MKCPYCGNDLPNEAKFCNNCGEKIETTLKKENQYTDKWKSLSGGKKVLSVIGACCILLIIIALIIGFLTPDATDDVETNITYNNTSSNMSISSSSNDYDDSYYYEDEYGSAHTTGKVYSDGSVEAHQKGYTEYGEYEINSYMDSEGNIHGTVTTGGHTYYV